MDAHTSSLVPRCRDIAAIVRLHPALIETPTPDNFAVAMGYRFSKENWGKITEVGSLTVHLFEMASYADAWSAIERRWEMEDYSVCTCAYPEF